MSVQLQRDRAARVRRFIEDAAEQLQSIRGIDVVGIPRQLAATSRADSGIGGVLNYHHREAA